MHIKFPFLNILIANRNLLLLFITSFILGIEEEAYVNSGKLLTVLSV